MTERRPQQLDLGLDVSVSLPEAARTALLREAGFAPEIQGQPADPDAHLSSQPPIGEAVYDAADQRTLRSIGNQLADVIETF